MSLVINFYYTSSVLNMFRTLIHPSSGACDFFYCITTLVVCSCFDVSWSFGVVVLGWSEAVFQPATRIPPQPATPKFQHTSKQEHTTNVVIQ